MGTLYYGACLALEAAERIGFSLGLPPLLIGLFIVGFGTSLPEFFVSQSAAYHGHFPMALGNILGSNMANLLLIMGVVGLVAPLPLPKNELWGHLLFHLLLTLILAWVMAQDTYSPLQAAILGLFFLVYARYNRGHSAPAGDPREKAGPRQVIRLLLGLALLFGGGELLVYAGGQLGLLLGVSTFVISAVLVAFGTSFPELVTCLVAVGKKKDTNLIVGNLLGSNIFNVAFVLASLAPYSMPLSKAYFQDALTLLAPSLALLILCAGGFAFSRAAGALFLGLYGLVLFLWWERGMLP